MLCMFVGCGGVGVRATFRRHGYGEHVSSLTRQLTHGLTCAQHSAVGTWRSLSSSPPSSAARLAFLTRREPFAGHWQPLNVDALV